MTRTPEQLKGKTVYYIGQYGFRGGVVTKVTNGPRTGFRSMSVSTTGWKRPVTVTPKMMDRDVCGVMWFGKVRPLQEWLS